MVHEVLEMNFGRSKFSNEPLAIYWSIKFRNKLFWSIWNRDVLEGRLVNLYYFEEYRLDFPQLNSIEEGHPIEGPLY